MYIMYMYLKTFFTRKPFSSVWIRESFRLWICEGGRLYNPSVKYTDIYTDRGLVKPIRNSGTRWSECSLDQGVQSQFWRFILAPPLFSHCVIFNFYYFYFIFFWKGVVVVDGWGGGYRLRCIFSSRVWIFLFSSRMWIYGYRL